MFLLHKRPIMRALFCYPDGSDEEKSPHTCGKTGSKHAREKRFFFMQEKMIFEAHMNEKLCYTEIMKKENGCKGSAWISFFYTRD